MDCRLAPYRSVCVSLTSGSTLSVGFIRLIYYFLKVPLRWAKISIYWKYLVTMKKCIWHVLGKYYLPSFVSFCNLIVYLSWVLIAEGLGNYLLILEIMILKDWITFAILIIAVVCSSRRMGSRWRLRLQCEHLRSETLLLSENNKIVTGVLFLKRSRYLQRGKPGSCN